METKDDDAIQMIEDSIEGIKGLDGYNEIELVGNNEVDVSIPMPPIGPIRPQTRPSVTGQLDTRPTLC